MLVGLPVAFMLFAQAASAAPNDAAHAPTYGPVAASPLPPPKRSSDQTERECAPQNKDPNAKEIVVCAVKPDGYRLPPDIVEARRLKKEGATTRPNNPHETYADHSCAHVGPMGCRGAPTLDMLSVAATAAEISKRMAKGQEIGSVFETEKSPTDYQYYEMARKGREAREAAAMAKSAKAKAVAATKAFTAARQQSAEASGNGQEAPPASWNREAGQSAPANPIEQPNPAH